MKYTPRQYAIKIFWLIANPIQTLYWFVVRPHTQGVKCLIENDGTFLLVRLNYKHRRWTLPGGGVQRGESPEMAAIRETHEEVGIRADDVVKLGEYQSTFQYKVDTVHVYYHKTNTREFTIDGFEIAEAHWFNADALPEERMPTVDKIIAMYHAMTPVE